MPSGAHFRSRPETRVFAHGFWVLLAALEWEGRSLC